MKTILALCSLILIAGGVLLFRYLRAPSLYGVFGGAPRAEVIDLIERPKEFLRRTVALEGVIKEQCTSMGCYFFFHSGKKALRVDISEIAMTAPRRNGRPARVEGQLVPFADGYQFWASAVEFK